MRTPLGQAKRVLYSEVSSFKGAICTENGSLGPDEVFIFHIMSSFRRVAIHRFDYNDIEVIPVLWFLAVQSWYMGLSVLASTMVCPAWNISNRLS
jgi:hypothetical protein